MATSTIGGAGLSRETRISASRFQQRDVVAYSFSISADMLLLLGRVERFGESAEGVNRAYDENRAASIAVAMTQPGTVMLENILGDFRGGPILMTNPPASSCSARACISPSTTGNIDSAASLYSTLKSGRGGSGLPWRR
jgi:hypothetical protein